MGIVTHIPTAFGGIKFISLLSGNNVVVKNISNFNNQRRMKMSSLQFLSNGNWYSPVFNASSSPILVKKKYNTGGNGWCDDLVVPPRQLMWCISKGSPATFAQYVVGPKEDVFRYLIQEGYEAHDIWSQLKSWVINHDKSIHQQFYSGE